MHTRLRQLTAEQDQSPWLDSLSRDLITTGQLQTLIDQGIRGVTANPSIFAEAITHSEAYTPAIEQLASGGATPLAIAEQLMVEDISLAADLFEQLHTESGGRDGWVSIEVSPRLADDTQGMIMAARRFAEAIARPNVFIKVPATPAGLPAIRQLLIDGINVNITLIFTMTTYRDVVEAYLAALEERIARSLPVDRTASVASFFVSRIDTRVDALLDERIAVESEPGQRQELASLRGTAAIANARLAYQQFMATFNAERFRRLERQGARVQRPLWASTGTKNPDYPDLLYVEELIGPDTVTTLPRPTVAALLDHGKIMRTVDRRLIEATATIDRLAALGIDLETIGDSLLADGIQQFVSAYDRLEAVIQEHVTALAV